MSRTVGLPVAIAAKLICENKITLRGVRIPVHAQIYQPVLDELEGMGIAFTDCRWKIPKAENADQ